MGLLDTLFTPPGQKSSGSSRPSTQRRDERFQDLDELAAEEHQEQAHTEVWYCELEGQRDLINVKDKLYDGELVLVDITFIDNSNLNHQRVASELRDVADEVNGDIVQRDEMIVAAPSGIRVSRQSL